MAELETTDPIVLRLYVAGEAPNSIRAISNIKRLCERLDQPVTLEVIDVIESPLRALDDGVMLTPTLVKLSPPPVWKMVGDLSDAGQVRSALGINGDMDKS